jgi:hypothetical protein
MKNLTLLFILSLFFNTTFSQLSQFDFEKIGESRRRPIKILISAVWCGPCMQKFDSTIYEFKNDSTNTDLIIFDIGMFSKSKFKAKILNSYDTSKMFFLPYKYYDFSKLININPHAKALFKFLNDLKRKLNSNTDLRRFGYGDILFIDRNNGLSVIHPK